MLKKILNKNIVLLLIIFMIVEWFINPFGEFCLNDDWAYAASVKTLINTNKFYTGQWPAMTLYAHVLWGLIFSKVFGFSFSILRISILVLSFISLWLTNNLFFNLTKNKIYSFSIGILLLFNPLFLGLSNSYMTDISFFCFFIMSILFFQKYYSKENSYYLIFGFSASIVAIFIRQFGIILPLSFLLVSLIQYLNNKSKKHAIFYSLLFSTFILLLLFLFEHQNAKTLNESSSYQGFFYSKKTIKISLLETLEHFYVRLGLFLLYSGLFLFPILISETVSIYNRFKTSSYFSKITISIFLLLIIFVLHYFPCGNYIYNCGIGLETTFDLLELKQNINHSYSNLLFNTLIIFSVIGNILLIVLMFTFSSPIKQVKKYFIRNPFQLFCILTLFFYTIFITISNSFFDRYALTFFIIILLIITQKNFQLKRIPILTKIAISIYAIFTLLSIKDYFNYNKIKTIAINDLENVHFIPPQNINGGFEYNMWQSYSSNLKCDNSNNYKDYTLSFSLINGYSKFKQYSYQRYIPYKIDTIFVLHKNDN